MGAHPWILLQGHRELGIEPNAGIESWNCIRADVVETVGRYGLSLDPDGYTSPGSSAVKHSLCPLSCMSDVAVWDL